MGSLVGGARGPRRGDGRLRARATWLPGERAAGGLGRGLGVRGAIEERERGRQREAGGEDELLVGRRDLVGLAADVPGAGVERREMVKRYIVTWRFKVL